MRGNYHQFQMHTVDSLDEALRYMKSQEYKPIAGGTDVMVVFSAGKLSKSKYLNIWGIEELKKIKVSKEFVEIGALVTYDQIRENKILQKEFPNLVQAASETGAIAIQNRGTIGGNIANASPAADSPPALLTYDADVVLRSLTRTREVPYSSFHLDYKKMQMNVDELIVLVRLPRKTKGLQHFYRKIGTRKAQSISKVCLSAVMKKKSGKISHIRLGWGSIAAMPIRTKKIEEFLVGKNLTEKNIQNAAELLAKEIRPIDDIRSTGKYRMKVAQNALIQFLSES